MQRQNFVSLIHVSRVLLPGMLLVIFGGLFRPEAAVQPVSVSAKTGFVASSSAVSGALGDFNRDSRLAMANGSGAHSIPIDNPLIVSSGLFCPKNDFGTRSFPVSIAAGDFNGDHNLDLAVANNGNDGISILRGTGMGTFGPRADFSTGANPVSVAVGDFNGDTNLDLAVANQNNDNKVSILLGTGMGDFGAHIDFGTGSIPFAVAVGDFNGDHKVDLAVANAGANTVSILLNTTMPGQPLSFGPRTDVNTGSLPCSIAVGDFDHDGNLDLAVANRLSNNVSILLGTGMGGFDLRNDFPTSMGPASVVADYFDVDGKLDLAVANYGSNTVSILLNTTTAIHLVSFGTKTDFMTGSNPRSVVTGEFNGDHKVDLAVANFDSSTVSILLGADPGRFAEKIDFGAGVNPASVVADHFNSDGKLDLAVANFSSDTVSILLSNCNTPPGITATPITRIAGNPSTNSQIATVNDAEDPRNTLTVTVNGGIGATVNGVTVMLNPSAPDASGQVFADVVAACTATAATFTLRVTDSSGLFNEAMLTVMVTPPPTPAILPTSQAFPSSGGAASVNVTSPPCPWTAVSNDPSFISITSGSSGSGNGTVNYSVAVNTGPARTGTMTIATQTFTVTQDSACTFMLSPTSQNFVPGGGVNSVNVTMATGCTWTAVRNDAFITINSGTPGSGDGTVNYTVAANTGPVRMGTMTIAGITFTVTQDSMCTFTLDRDHQSFAGNGGPGTVNVTTSDPACTWTASTSGIVSITSGSSGTGNGAVQYMVAPNAGTTIRSNTIAIAGQTFTVYQGVNFLDVLSGDSCYDDIGKLSARGVTVGCGNGNYCPDSPVKRDQMAAFIMRAKGEFNPPMPLMQRFNDVLPPPSPPGNVFYDFVDRLAALGISLGCTPDQLMYCPSDSVTREQMAAFIVRALGEFNPPTPLIQRFADVPPSNPFYNFIDRLAALNITLGCTPDHFLYCPSDPVTRCQMASFLVRAFDL